MKSNLKILGVEKLSFYAVLEPLNFVLSKFQPSKIAQNHQRSYFRASKILKKNPPAISQIRFHVKSEWQKNSEISTH